MGGSSLGSYELLSTVGNDGPTFLARRRNRADQRLFAVRLVDPETATWAISKVGCGWFPNLGPLVEVGREGPTWFVVADVTETAAFDEEVVSKPRRLRTVIAAFAIAVAIGLIGGALATPDTSDDASSGDPDTKAAVPATSESVPSATASEPAVPSSEPAESASGADPEPAADRDATPPGGSSSGHEAPQVMRSPGSTPAVVHDLDAEHISKRILRARARQAAERARRARRTARAARRGPSPAPRRRASTRSDDAPEPAAESCPTRSEPSGQRSAMASASERSSGSRTTP